MSRLYQRGKKGTWWVKYYVDDRQCYKRVGVVSHKKAIIAQKKLDLAVLEGTIVAPAPRPKTGSKRLEDLIARYINSNAPRVSANTLESYRSRRRIILGRISPGKVFTSPEQLESIVADYITDRKRNASDGTIRNELSFLRAVLNHAGLDSLSRHVKLTAMNPEQEINPLDEAEINRLLEAARGSWLEDWIQFYLRTGARVHEAALVKWSDVKDGKVTIRGKTKQTAAVPVGPELAAIFNRRKAEGLSQPFPAFNRSTGRLELARIAKRAGLEDKVGGRFHFLRHTFATRLHATGASIATMTYLMRHSKVQQTLRYVTEDKAVHQKAIAALGF